ncbi:MAG: Mur ligase family protein [Verrucomicrobiota bacterium]|nr:Mur ligase family protein [Verrucomicrobiota bacterium]
MRPILPILPIRHSQRLPRFSATGNRFPIAPAQEFSQPAIMRVYFMGICGTAMGQAALLMREMGHEVLGADTGVYPPMSDVLAASGIQVFDGYSTERLASLKPDLVVIGNAQSRGHPEVEWLLDTRSLRTISLPALLHDLVLSKRQSIVVAGTHGKTTTTTLAAYLLREAGANPGWLIGGVPRDVPGGSHAGYEGGPFVIEGDEYDSAFFDKRSKFIHYAPRILLCNNLEFDHADIFRDLVDVQRTFNHVMRIVPRSGYIVANGDDANLAPLLKNVSWTTVLRVGEGEGNDLRIVNFSEDATGARFQLVWKRNGVREIAWQLPGRFNARNAAMAALAAGLAINPNAPQELNLAALNRFLGVKRRQELLASNATITAIEDFGHHPTAISETLVSLRNRHPGCQLAACFEPRSNTAMKSIFQREFTQALGLADAAFIAPVHRADKLAPAERLDTAAMANAICKAGKWASDFTTSDTLYHSLVQKTASAGPWVVVFFSNGSFDGIIPRFKEYLLNSTATG